MRDVKRLIRESAGTEFAASIAAGYAIYSTLNSSPWTAESFGGDPDKARSCLFYARLATITNVALGIFTSFLTASVWPLLGFGIVTAEMEYLYRRAVRVAKRRGSTTFTDASRSTAAPAFATVGRPR